jgi:hypothetical protein
LESFWSFLNKSFFTASKCCIRNAQTPPSHTVLFSSHFSLLTAILFFCVDLKICISSKLSLAPYSDRRHMTE